MDYSKLEDKTSPYYFGLDSQYKFKKSAPAQTTNTRPQFEFGIDGVPYRVQPQKPQDKAPEIEPQQEVSEILQKSSGLDTRNGSRAALSPNATESFKSAFELGQKNMGAIQQMYGDRPDLQEWAKSNPALAQKQYEKFQKKQKAMDISAFQADSGMSRKAAETILSGGARETVIDGSKPMVTTMIPANKFGGQQVQIPGSTEGKLDQGAQDLIAAKQETGAVSFSAEEILSAQNADDFLKRAMERIKASR